MTKIDYITGNQFILTASNGGNSIPSSEVQQVEGGDGSILVESSIDNTNIDMFCFFKSDIIKRY